MIKLLELRFWITLEKLKIALAFHLDSTAGHIWEKSEHWLESLIVGRSMPIFVVTVTKRIKASNLLHSFLGKYSHRSPSTLFHLSEIQVDEVAI